jgi:hypothetical protein
MLTDGGEIVSLTRRPRATPQKQFLYSFFGRGGINPRAITRLEGLGTLEKNPTASGFEPVTFQDFEISSLPEPLSSFLSNVLNSTPALPQQW